MIPAEKESTEPCDTEGLWARGDRTTRLGIHIKDTEMEVDGVTEALAIAIAADTVPQPLEVLFRRAANSFHR